MSITKGKTLSFNFIFKILLFSLLSLSIFSPEVLAYNPQAALDWIWKFAGHPNEYNPDDGYWNYDTTDNPFGEIRGNCANAVS